jgi:hypothetical protein
MEGLTLRMMRAMRLESALYEEVEADTNATSQALLVVVIASVASGIGGVGHGGVVGLVAGVVMALLGWAVWAGLTYVIGTRLLPGPNTKSDMGELLRTTGFAASPGIVRVLGVIPLLGVPVNLVAGIWMLAAFVVAVRQALDYESTGRAVLVCVIGWLVYMGFILAVSALVVAAGYTAAHH